MIPGLIVAFVALQATSAGIAGVKPAFLPDVPLLTVLLFGAFNPAAMAVSVWMGRRADQSAKILVAAFAGAIAGAALLWLGTTLRIGVLATPGRAAAGIFVASFLFGLLWAGLGYQSVRRRKA